MKDPTFRVNIRQIKVWNRRAARRFRRELREASPTADIPDLQDKINLIYQVAFGGSGQAELDHVRAWIEAKFDKAHWRTPMMRALIYSGDFAAYRAEARALFDLPTAELTSVTGPGQGNARLAFRENGQLVAALFVSPTPIAVMRDYLATLPDQPDQSLLSGRSPADVPDPGPILCSCFGVGVNTILSAIEADGLLSVEAIGAALQAGTNCGSCRPELADLLASVQQREAAE